MDPVGSWYASYNRLTASGSNGTFQTSTTTGDFVSHHLATAPTQAVPSTTTSQLLLQAAHTTVTLAGQPSPFNPGGFLSPSPVGYDVFSPLFHHPNSKQAHYVTQHRQALTQVQPVSATKQNATTESDIPALRENYSSAHQATFFEQQGASTSPTTSTLAWTHQNNTQLPSPFGILPHESVVPSSPGPPSTKSNSTGYENNFNAHFNTTQTINNINSQLTSPSACGTDFKASGCPETKKPINQVPTTFTSDTLTNSYTAGNGNQSSGNGKVQTSLQHQQSCIVSTPNNTSGKEYRIPQPPSRSTASATIFLNNSVRSSASQVQDKQGTRNSNFTSPPNKTAAATQQNIQTKAQTKIYPEIGSHVEHRRNEPQGHDNSQSSPISFSIMDSRGLNYAANNTTNCNNTNGKLTNNQRTSSNGNLQSHPQQQQQQQQTFHILNQQQHQQQQQQTTSYRHYLTGSTSDTEYHTGRSKSVTSTDSAYSSNTSTQNGPDCSVVVPRRPSPLQAHSQASPLGHVPSPAYPMYNSPMATMSSPSPLQQHTENNGNQCASGAPYKATVQQVTPPSPLDVTVPRPASQGQVVYSSVITRALGTTENNKATYNTENKTYDRQQQQQQQQDFTQAQKQQVCWETDNRQTNNSRKFVTVYTGANTDINVQNLPVQQQVQRLVNVSDRQQPYFETNQVALQDLSSCRGDPMSIVKNLQTLQQSPCQVQQHVVVTTPTGTTEQQKQAEERRKADNANKKRKNLEKGGHGTPLNELTGTATMTEYLSRIPPPAHHNTNQQQQNGYFDFERWNLPHPPTKMFPTTSGAFSSQSSLHHTSNFVGTPAHQHQSLMVSHHHAPPPIPYFPTFHIPAGHHPHHPHEFQSSVDITPIGFSENATNQNANYNQEVRNDQPKVIVPNIEEELGFLQQDQQLMPTMNQINKDFKRSNKNHNMGFMTSYLKFLQGERDPSPPPAMRGGRKATWNRSKPYIPVESSKSAEVSTNGEIIKPQEKPTSVKETPAIDYANDPRYFPLPKERKKQNFDSSDDGFTSDDDFLFPPKKTEKKVQSANNTTNTEVITIKPEGQKSRKGRPIKPGGPTDRKRRAAAAAAAAAATEAAANGSSDKKILKKVEEVDPLLLPPRRETSRRKAKEKTSAKQFLDRQQGIDYFDNDEEQVDSDSDPAWTPAVKLAGDEEEKRKKRARPVITKKIRKILEEDGYSSGEIIVTKKSTRKKHEVSSKNSSSSGKISCKIDEKLIASVSDEDIDISPFKSGEFVVIKTDLGEEYPPLWRIDGKTLLQKYEPFKSNGKTLYRNISTYSGWAPQNRHIYQQVPVKFLQQGKIETIVEFLRDEITIDDSESMNKFMKDTEKYQDNFEVYIQTLISQALDSNFLTEIFQEQDDYFLSNVKTVDEVTNERKRRLLSMTKWKSNIVTAISTWPCLNVLKDLPEYKGKSCAGCQQTRIHARVLLYGQPYNGTTLEGSPPDPRISYEKDFLLCRICQTKIALYNKVAHQKYLMFLECAGKVTEKRVADPHKDTTIILNELLADEAWLNQLFKEVRSIWAEIDSMEQQAKTKMKPKATLSSSATASAPNVLTPKETVNTSDSQVPIQNTENNPQTVSYDIQISNVLS